MAVLQYKNNPRVEGDTHGYSADVSSGKIENWTNVGLNGSHTTVLYWDDNSFGGSCAGTESRVYMTIVDSWSATVNNDTNAITINVTSSFSMNRTTLKWGATDCSTNFCWRDVHVYAGRSGSEIKYCADCITNTGVFCSGERSFSITLQHGQETDIGSFFVRNDSRGYENVYYDLVSAGVRFRNDLPAPKTMPSATSSCTPYASGSTVGATAKLTGINYGCPAGNDCSPNLATILLYSDPEYKELISSNNTSSGSSTVEYKGLTPNHKYYVKYVITNGKYTKNYTCSFTTMASSYPYGYRYLSEQVSWIYLQINNGDGACSIVTKLYIREKGTSDWQLIDTTTSTTGVRETLRGVVVRGKTYEAYTTTANCAGTYSSPVYEFAPPAADSITGVITSQSANLEASGMLADLDYCYLVTSYAQEAVSETNPITSHLEYSTDKVNWTPTDDVTSTTNPVTLCGTVKGLLCGTTYYLRSYQKIGSASSYSAITSIATPTCANYDNCVCDNLSYMTDLICQQLYRIKMGQKTIYTNCDTKVLCDPYSGNPTLASILSRLLRFAQAVACLTCSLEALDIFRSGEEDQVFTASVAGKAGQWITEDYSAVEGSENLLTSSGAKEAIEDGVNSVFHPIGTYEYYGDNMAELQAQSSDAEDNDRAIIGNEYYTFGNGTWTNAGEVPDLNDFAVITITKGKYNGSNFFWWNDKWKLISVSGADGIEERIEKLDEELATEKVVNSYDPTVYYKVTVVPDNLSDENIKEVVKPDHERDIIIFTVVDTVPSNDIVVGAGDAGPVVTTYL